MHTETAPETALGHLPVPRMVVLGVGNVLQGDDGAGVHVIRRLAAEELPPGVDLIDAGTLGLVLLDAVERADCLIVVDAADLGLAPGTVRVLEDAALERLVHAGSVQSVHEAGLRDVLAAARLRGRSPGRCVLIGIQPDCLGWRTEPSSAVQGAIAPACDLIRNLLREVYR